MSLIQRLFGVCVVACLVSCGGSDAGGGGGSGATVEAPTGGDYLAVGLDGSVAKAQAGAPDATRLLFVRSASTGLYIGVHPVTREQWQGLMGTAPWAEVAPDVLPATTEADLPACNLSHSDALAGASELAVRSGLGVMLMPAAAWRAEIGTGEYPWGSSVDPALIARHAVTAETATGPRPSGRRRASPAGLHDLIGNVRQWTAEGTLVGGSWQDGILRCGRSTELDTVPPDERHPLCGVRLALIGPSGGNTAPDPGPVVALPPTLVGAQLGVDAATLLAGASDADGDSLRVVGLGSARARVAGDGPWSISCTVADEVELRYLVVDGRGGAAVGRARLVAVDPIAYDRYADRRGPHRLPHLYSSNYVAVPSVTAGGAVVEYAFGFRLAGFAGREAGVETDATFCRGAASAHRSTLTFAMDGSITIVDEAGRKCVISPVGGPSPGETWDCRLRLGGGRIVLYRRVAGSWSVIGDADAAGFDRWEPARLLVGGSQRAFHGTVYYWAVERDGVPVHDVRMDEMAGTALADALEGTQAARAGVAQGLLEWRDEIADGEVPDPDVVVSGAVEHGATLVITASRAMFPGGLPAVQLYDDGTRSGMPASGVLDTGATLSGGRFVDWSFIKNPAGQTWKPGGPGGRSYTVDYDGASDERVSRGLELPAGFSEAFIARSLRVPAERAWPGSHDEGDPWTPTPSYIPSDSTWKTDWLLSADDSGHTGSDLVVGSHSAADQWTFVGNSVSTESPKLPIRLRPVIAFGEWFSARSWVRHDPADPGASPAVASLSTSRSGTIVHRASGFILAADRGLAPFRLWLSGAWLDRNPLCLAQRADVYAAFGANAACRVEIGDAPVYSRCTALAACPPLLWTPDRIEVRCATGIFDPATTTLYAFIIGPDGMPVLPYGKRLD